MGRVEFIFIVESVVVFWSNILIYECVKMFTPVLLRVINGVVTSQRLHLFPKCQHKYCNLVVSPQTISTGHILSVYKVKRNSTPTI